MCTINRVKEFWDKQPCNIQHSQLEVGTRAYFEEVEKKKFFVEPHILDFANFPAWKDKKVLEIGCGIGTDTLNFVKHGAKYVGVDLSSRSLTLTQKRLQVYHLQGECLLGNAEVLSTFLPKQTFDLVYSFGVVHHSPRPDLIMSQVKEYMHPNSELRLMVYAKHSWKNCMIEAGCDRPEAQNHCPIANTYTHNEVKHLLKDFQILSIEQDHIFPYQIPPYKAGKYIKEPWFEHMPSKMFKTLERKLGWHLLIKAKLL